MGKVKTRTDFPGERGGGGGAFESQPSFYCAQKVSVLNIAMYGQQSPASVKQCVGIWESRLHTYLAAVFPPAGRPRRSRTPTGYRVGRIAYPSNPGGLPRGTRCTTGTTRPRRARRSRDTARRCRTTRRISGRGDALLGTCFDLRSHQSSSRRDGYLTQPRARLGQSPKTSARRRRDPRRASFSLLFPYPSTLRVSRHPWFSSTRPKHPRRRYRPRLWQRKARPWTSRTRTRCWFGYRSTPAPRSGRSGRRRRYTVQTVYS